MPIHMVGGSLEAEPGPGGFNTLRVAFVPIMCYNINIMREGNMIKYVPASTPAAEIYRLRHEGYTVKFIMD